MTTTFARERTLQDEIAPLVEERVSGVDVLAVELLSPSRFCVYIDHPEGVDHALCQRVTRALDAFRSEYTIDVSSPGLQRPLRRRAHFQDVVDRRVSIRMSDAISGKSRFRGVVVDAGIEAVTLETAETGEIRIPYEAIVRANLIDEGLTT